MLSDLLSSRAIRQGIEINVAIVAWSDTQGMRVLKHHVLREKATVESIKTNSDHCMSIRITRCHPGRERTLVSQSVTGGDLPLVSKIFWRLKFESRRFTITQYRQL